MFIKRDLGLRSHAIAALAVCCLLLGGCVMSSQNRLAMVKDKETGLLIGSTVEKTIVTDPSLYKNNKIKIRIRNTSGDVAFDLYGFQRQLETTYRSIGYEPTDDGDFGILVDVNVKYSGHIREDMAAEYAFLGGVSGNIAGMRSSQPAARAIGTVAGATVGAILGSFVTEDTYIIISDVSVAAIKERYSPKPAKTVTFSRSPKTQAEIESDEEMRRLPKRSMSKIIGTGVAVYAGGTNTEQSEIAQMVRERIARIVGNII